MKIQRWKESPIPQHANDLSWCRAGIRKPGAVLDGDTVRVLFTTNRKRGYQECGNMRLGYAGSKDGFIDFA